MYLIEIFGFCLYNKKPIKDVENFILYWIKKLKLYHGILKDIRIEIF